MVKAQSGFTLLEVIVSVSILTVIALGIAHLMENTDRQERVMRVKQAAFSYQQNLRYERKVTEPPSSGP